MGPKGLLLALVVLGALAFTASASRDLERKRHDKKRPWFCHGRDCPRFKELKRWGPFSLRRYERSNWAAACTHDAPYEEGVWRASAALAKYLHACNKQEKRLWGGVPWARIVHLEPRHLEAWNATAAAMEAGNTTIPGLDCPLLHKTVCVAKYLPEKYQGKRRPPKPHSHEVMVVRVPRWTAHVLGFDGFPTRMRFLFNYMRLVRMLKWHKVEFNWKWAMGFVYDPPFAEHGRHNEVLVPDRDMHDMLFGEGAEVVYPASSSPADDSSPGDDEPSACREDAPGGGAVVHGVGGKEEGEEEGEGGWEEAVAALAEAAPFL